MSQPRVREKIRGRGSGSRERDWTLTFRRDKGVSIPAKSELAAARSRGYSLRLGEFELLTCMFF